MKKSLTLFTLLCVGILSLSAQPYFTNQLTTLVPGPENYSGVAMGVSDLNGDGMDDVIRLASASNPDILLQQTNGNFTRFDLGDVFDGGGFWGLCIGDVDNNGANDIAFGGTNGTFLLRGGTVNGNFSWFSSSMPATAFQQGANFVDIDEDGWVDHFACDDVALSLPSRNSGDGTGTFTEDYNLINPVSTVPSDNSGNYASIWSDFDDDGDADLYLSKCRLFVNDVNDGRRLNQLFRNDGVDGFTDIAESVGLLPRAQTWSADFADVDNDGHLDAFLLNHDIPSQLLINDGNNNFIDRTLQRGMGAALNNIPGGSLGIQCNFEDFDNDGWVDLLVTYNQSFAQLFRNDGNGNFSLVSGNDLTADVSEQVFQSVATGDLNNDGYVDLYTGHASGFNGPSGQPDALMMNVGGTNNFLTVRLQGVASNRSGVGAKIKIYGSWGVQTREIRSGEGYGISNSLTAHFGLGTDTEIDRMVIRWPSGLEEEVLDVAANSRLLVPEGSLSMTLPLVWNSVTATPAGNKRVKLDWQTQREEATSHFIAERRDGNRWLTVGRIAALTTTGVNNYQLYDDSPVNGENVYRIRQVDLTGEESISSLASATINATGFVLSPNPATDFVNIQNVTDPATRFTVETMDGRVIRRFSGSRIDLTDFAPGVYLVRSGEQTEKLVVR